MYIQLNSDGRKAEKKMREEMEKRAEGIVISREYRAGPRIHVYNFVFLERRKSSMNDFAMGLFQKAVQKLLEAGLLTDVPDGNHSVFSNYTKGYCLNPRSDGRFLYFSLWNDAKEYADRLGLPDLAESQPATEVKKFPGNVIDMQNPSPRQWRVVRTKLHNLGGSGDGSVEMNLEELAKLGLIVPAREGGYLVLGEKSQSLLEHLELARTCDKYCFPSEKIARSFAESYPNKQAEITQISSGA